MKKGFTLIEMLVASLLLGMLVSILTMVFNASSIAWRTGRASMVDLDKTRRQVSLLQRLADDTIYDQAANALTVVRTPWDDSTDSRTGEGASLRTRAVRELTGSTWFGVSDLKDTRGPWKVVNSISGRDGSTRQHTYTVGVWSYGPDGQPDTADDITSWPEGIQ
ncbi:MAG: prepilin-type N-terminal cleavage/methylation domain-containing protein [Kiritimatiellia bacterium]